MRTVAALASVVLLLTGCGSGDEPAAESSSAGEQQAGEQRFPDVVDVVLEPSGDGYDVDVTISSPYDTPERYADGWRVLDPSGEVLGEHELTHDHGGEQPFTRTQSGLEIPEGVTEVTIEGRDLENGFGGETKTVPVPDSR